MQTDAQETHEEKHASEHFEKHANKHTNPNRWAHSCSEKPSRVSAGVWKHSEQKLKHTQT